MVIFFLVLKEEQEDYVFIRKPILIDINEQSVLDDNKHNEVGLEVELDEAENLQFHVKNTGKRAIGLQWMIQIFFK